MMRRTALAPLLRRGTKEHIQNCPKYDVEVWKTHKGVQIKQTVLFTEENSQLNLYHRIKIILCVV